MAARKKKAGASTSLAEVAGTMPMPEDRESIRVRKIQNGYVVCHEGVKKGRYFDREVFTPTKPNLGAVTKATAAVTKAVPK